MTRRRLNVSEMFVTILWAIIAGFLVALIVFAILVTPAIEEQSMVEEEYYRGAHDACMQIVENVRLCNEAVTDMYLRRYYEQPSLRFRWPLVEPVERPTPVPTVSGNSY